MTAEPLTARQVRDLRSPKPSVDPWATPAWSVEEERQPGGGLARVVTVFLAGRECPFACVFCDLWRHTLEGPTPPGALPHQLEAALSEAAAAEPGLGPRGGHVKLYNAASFDPTAVPPRDLPALRRLLAPFAQVVVECHPRVLGEPCLDLARDLPGRLQVAMGLETVHPRALAASCKRMTPSDFAAATERSLAAGAGVRAFVLVGAPYVPAAEAAAWIDRTVVFALGLGVEHVTLIPVRGGNGALEALAEHGAWDAGGSGGRLAELETAFERALGLADEAGGSAVVTADLWDLERFAACPACSEARRVRLERMNLGGSVEARVRCEVCGGRAAPVGEEG